MDFTEDTDYFSEFAVFTTRLSVKDTSQVNSTLCIIMGVE